MKIFKQMLRRAGWLLLMLGLLSCANPLEPEPGTLTVTLAWPSTALEKAAVQPDRVQFSLQPGDHQYQFAGSDTVCTLTAALGIYNISLQVYDTQNRLVGWADTSEVLIQPGEAGSLRLPVSPAYPVEAPQFTGRDQITLQYNGDYELVWTEVDQTDSYRLEEATDSTFTAAASVYTGAAAVHAVTGQDSGCNYYRVRAENDIDVSPWSRWVAVVVRCLEPMSIGPDSLTDGMVQQPYADTLAVTGGLPPYEWTLNAGALPQGLTLTPEGSRCIISGTPLEAGQFNLTFAVSDSLGSRAEKELSLTVAPPLLNILTAELPDGQSGEAYEARIDAEGGSADYTFTVLSGELPPGLSLRSAGECAWVEGTPSAAGEYAFTVQVTDNVFTALSDTQSYALTIQPPDLSITTSSLPRGDVGESYEARIDAEGGSADYTFAIIDGSLPTGLSLRNAGECAWVEGTPSVAGEYAINVEVTDNVYSGLSDSRWLTVFIDENGLEITTSSLADGILGGDYNEYVNSVNGQQPLSWSVVSGSLPPGLSLDLPINDFVAIGGTPTAVGTFAFTLQVTDSRSPQQSDTRALSITITPPPLEIVTTSLSNSQVSEGYAERIDVDGGSADYTFSVISGSLPPGFTLRNAGECAWVEGIATTAGTYEFTIQAVDNVFAGLSDTQSYTVIIE